MIRWKQQADGFTDWGLTFGDPDFVAHAASYGAGGSRGTGADGLVSALEAAFKAGGVGHPDGFVRRIGSIIRISKSANASRRKV